MSNSVKNLIINTAKEYNRTLGCEYKVILREIDLLQDIEVDTKVEKNNTVKSIYKITLESKEYTISTLVKKEVTQEDEASSIEGGNACMVRMDVFAVWESRNNVDKDLFEYSVELSGNRNNNEQFTLSREFHEIDYLNCEDLRNNVLPTCDLISFFDIFLLTLIRFSFPQLNKHLSWDESIIPIRNSLLEHIASEECQEEPEYTCTESEEEEPTFKKKRGIE
ncbi:hypothetical protein HWI79_88 [Cryptosporidium felis]|nr:hypothetical protein HWI79_88 [Cryptosporidium felis]